MFKIMILVFFLVFSLSGCATSSKKQAAQSQPIVSEKPQRTYQQEAYSQDYDWLSDSSEKQTKKSYSEATVSLSPKQIQRALKSAGFYEGPIDGKIGSKTKEAIIKLS